VARVCTITVDDDYATTMTVEGPGQPTVRATVNPADAPELAGLLVRGMLSGNDTGAWGQPRLGLLR
jgi:hypothetical protein